MTTRPARQHEPVELSVREANHHFYEAFAALDLERMEGVWLHEDWIACVHPGWNLLLGWDEVRESWERIFSSTKRVKAEISSIWVRVEGATAWVSCTERITSTFEQGFDEVLAQATNIFVRRPAPEGSADAHRWFLVAHHASPLLAEDEGKLQ